MRKLWCMTIVAVLASAGAASAQKNGEKANGAPVKVKTNGKVGRLDITTWPAFEGATLTTEVNVDGEQLKQMGDAIPADAKPILGKLQFVNVRGYRLPKGADPKKVVAFYEPRVLAAGYKVLVKDFSEPGEGGSAVYTGPGGAILVLDVGDDGEQELEIVSVLGDIKSLSALGALKGLHDPKEKPVKGPKKVAPQPAPKPDPAPAPPKDDAPQDPTAK